MKIIMNDRKELEVIMVTGGKRQLQGAYRDCLNFIFDDTTSMDEIDNIFTETNCESISIIGNDGNDVIYKGYTIRAELKKTDEVIHNEDTETEAETVKRITVSMAQRTYTETKLAAVAQESIDTQLAVAELAEIVMGGAE